MLLLNKTAPQHKTIPSSPVTWKFVFKCFFCLLLCTQVNSWAKNTTEKPHDHCRPDLITAPFNIEECVAFFNQKLALLCPKDIKTYEADFAKAKKIEAPIMEMADLFKTYPYPEVLFEMQEAGVVISKQLYEDKLLSYDQASTGLSLANYGSKSKMYKTVIAMLENKNKLSENEKQMIQISRKRSQCLDQWLGYLGKDDSRAINNRQIVDECFRVRTH